MTPAERARLVQTAEAWELAETALSDERARYLAVAWGEPYEWTARDFQVEPLDQNALDRLNELREAARLAQAAYEAAVRAATGT